MLHKTKVQQLKKERIHIKWQSLIRLLLILDGKNLWLIILTLLKKIETSVLWPTSMLVRQLPQKEFYITQEKVIRLVRYMMVPQQWIGWNRNKKEVSLLLLRQLLVFGEHIELILLIHLDTLILQSR